MMKDLEGWELEFEPEPLAPGGCLLTQQIASDNWPEVRAAV